MSGDVRHGWLNEHRGPGMRKTGQWYVDCVEQEHDDQPCVVLSGAAIGEWERARRLLALVEGERRDEAIDALMEVFAFWGIDEFDSDDASRLLDAMLALLDAPEPQP